MCISVGITNRFEHLGNCIFFPTHVVTVNISRIAGRKRKSGVDCVIRIAKVLGGKRHMDLPNLYVLFDDGLLSTLRWYVLRDKVSIRFCALPVRRSLRG